MTPAKMKSAAARDFPATPRVIDPAPLSLAFFGESESDPEVPESDPESESVPFFFPPVVVLVARGEISQLLLKWEQGVFIPDTVKRADSDRIPFSPVVLLAHRV